MSYKPALLVTDYLIFILMAATALWLAFALEREYWRSAFKQLLKNRVAIISLGVLSVFGVIGLLDSLHYKEVTPDNPEGGRIKSVLDAMFGDIGEKNEKSFSAPFATHAFSKETMESDDGQQVRDFPRLRHAGTALKEPTTGTPEQKREAIEALAAADIQQRVVLGLLVGAGLGIVLAGFIYGLGMILSHGHLTRDSLTVWIAGFAFVISVLGTLAWSLAFDGGYHIFGTDKAGVDVFYVSMKSVRTGLVLGTLTTLIVTPFAIFFGLVAGYFGGWIDDAVQYVYTTLSSIPDILLIASVMLIVQAKIPESEDTMYTADLKLLALCVIMGITSWTGLCRLIRGEVLKLREMEFIQAADAFGVNRLTILFRHLIPNIMHLVLISVVLRFSGLVLTESVLTYVGIGVDIVTQSWGNMINAARLEIGRDPVVWWNLAAAFTFMLGLVLPANLFGDAVRDALDPKLRAR